MRFGIPRFLDGLLGVPDLVYRPTGAGVSGRRGVVASLLGYDVWLSEQMVGRSENGMVAGFRYEGPDLSLSEPAEIRPVADELSRGLGRLAAGTVVHWDVTRFPTEVVREPWQDEVRDSAVVAFDRMKNPRVGLDQQTRVFLGFHPDSDFLDPGADTLQGLEDRCNDFAGVFRGSSIRFERLEGSGLFGSLAEACRMRRYRGRSVPWSEYLDQALAVDEMRVSSERPVLQIGETFWSVVSVQGLSDSLVVGFAENVVRRLAFPCRWVSRLVVESKPESIRRIKAKRWGHVFSGIDGLSATQALFSVGDAKAGDAGVKKRTDVLVGDLPENCDEAHGAVVRGEVFGLASSWLFAGGATEEQAHARGREAVHELERAGFGAGVENFQMLEAYRGALPGDDRHFLKQLQIPVRTFAGMVPLGSPYLGEADCGYRKRRGFGPMMLCRTPYEELFHLNILGSEIADLLSFLVLGPAGAGKSVLLNAILSSLTRWSGTRIFSMDNGRSQTALGLLLGPDAAMREMGEGMGLAPFSEVGANGRIESEARLVEEILHLNGVDVSAKLSREVAAGLRRTGEMPRPLRTLENLVRKVQSVEARDALRLYVDGAYKGYLDGTPVEGDDRRTVLRLYEIKALLELDDRVKTPALLHFLAEMEHSLDGKNLCLVAVEEFHELVRNSRFLVKGLESGVKRWRKRLGGLGVVVHDVDLVSDGEFGKAMDAGIRTQFFLPNSAVLAKKKIRDAYSRLGLSAREIDAIGRASSKRDYYLKKGPKQGAWFRLDLTDIELALFSCSDDGSLEAERFAREHGANWLKPWAASQGVAAAEVDAFERVWSRERNVAA